MTHKPIVLIAVAGTVLALAAQVGTGVSSAMPANPTDQAKVPHYFGPYPNWANSPLTAPDATVAITGDGSGATATATVGANGAVTGLTITDPGSGYTAATIGITGAGTGASADAVVQTTGAVTSIAVDQAGGGYVKPGVAVTGGGATTDATAHAVGAVDAVNVGDPGSGYTFPTVSFDLPDDPNGLQAQGHAVCVEPNCTPATQGGTVTITGVAVDQAGSGYLSPPGVAILDGTQFDPINHDPGTFTAAALSSTLKIDAVVVDTGGVGYTSAPSVAITEANGSGAGAAATAKTDIGTITGFANLVGGTGYMTPGGIKKFTDQLPTLCDPSKGCTDNQNGQHIPVGVPDTQTFPGTNGTPAADYYTIAVVQHREVMSSSMPGGALTREYVQLSTAAVPGKHVLLSNDMPDGTSVAITMPDGSQAYGVDDPHYLGPVIVAQRDRAVRITFYNLLPTGKDGDLFLPVDSTMMGSGMGPMQMADPVDQGTVMDKVRNPDCTEYPKASSCYKDNRATLHLHGGVTPWISDGTPHQWITPANEATSWPRGVSVQNVPDMVGAGAPAGVPNCNAANSGCESFYYTNEQSARLMFYHDHSWGITRLNVYAGEAAGYVITDKTEQSLFGPTGPYADMGEGTPLIIQDRTFVPDAQQLAQQDPTWDSARWGKQGDLWYHHVYMPAQNPGDPGGMSAFGRWMYGPWFWPPATPQHGPIDNPYYDPNCNLDVPSTWQYQTDPFCEPKQIPGTPNISAGMEQFNDTPIVNGTAYPTTTVDPKAYRFRLLNAANDRFWNLQWYVADPSTGTDSEVALKAGEVAAAQTDPNVFPTPDTSKSPVGPDWIQIGTEGGFLPHPVVVKNQPTTWITDPTRFDFGNVDKHSMLLAPAERADTIVDFSQYAGKTLILYNDAPAAFPARVACYDYYTGDPDLSPACAPSTLPGYGPNTRTIMQVKVAANTPAPAFNLTALGNLFKHHADGSGVFESGQHPVIVGQAAYNSAYGTSFAASGDCSNPNGTNKCDGYARINQQGGDQFRFDTLKGPQLKVPLQPKALHDEMNAASFDEFGRMTANLGVEAVPASPAGQNITLYPYVNPQTELIDGTNLPNGDVGVKPISVGTDGTQIWKITHNGVDTHPIHFHLFDVQVLNRVTWDNIIIPPDETELGWKDTVRVSPLEDTIVALRPIVPTLPFEIPNSIRALNPMMPLGTADVAGGFNSVDPNGNPITPITNQLVNFGWEYVYHCHILSHEEMDMMRPVSLVLPPNKPATVSVAIDRSTTPAHFAVSFTDNSIAETGYVLERSSDGTTWAAVNGAGASLAIPLDQPNTKGSVLTLKDPTSDVTKAYQYRVVAQNTVGYGNGMPSMTASSTSSSAATPPAMPTNVTVTPVAANQPNQLSVAWVNPSTAVVPVTGNKVERSTTSAFTNPVVVAANAPVGAPLIDTGLIDGTTYYYRVTALNATGSSVTSAPASGVTPLTAPAAFTATASTKGTANVTLRWTRVTGTTNTGYVITRATNAAMTTGVVRFTLTNGALTSYVDSTVKKGVTYYYSIVATKGTTITSPSATAGPATPN
ncbi:MAG TPA: multicopper oxidase domain-containing protein [Jatrophihabitans sp.]|nr:multicopper oxidase domain-containing protein [Jatrophihabitans sp.]